MTALPAPGALAPHKGDALVVEVVESPADEEGAGGVRLPDPQGRACDRLRDADSVPAR